MASISYIGSTLNMVAGTPATEDQSGYEALSYVEIGKVVSFGPLGDTSEDISFTLLKTGRTKHVNGAKDLGEVAVTVEFDRADSGMTLLEAANNSNTNQSFKVTDTDGDDHYFQGIIANLTDPERTASTYKGKNFVVRGNTAIVLVDGS